MIVMKKIIFIFTFIFAIVITFNANTKVYYTCHKEDGKFVFNWFHSYIGYNSVIPAIYTDPESGNEVRHVDCTGPGHERCQYILISGNTQVSPNCTISTELINTIVNEMLTSIEDDVLEGKYKGSTNKKIQTTSVEGNLCILSFDANWINGNSEEDSMINISIDEVKL